MLLMESLILQMPYYVSSASSITQMVWIYACQDFPPCETRGDILVAIGGCCLRHPVTRVFPSTASLDGQTAGITSRADLRPLWPVSNVSRHRIDSNEL